MLQVPSLSNAVTDPDAIRPVSYAINSLTTAIFDMAVLVIPATALLAPSPTPAFAWHTPRISVVCELRSPTESRFQSDAEPSPTEVAAADMTEKSAIAMSSFSNRHNAEELGRVGSMLRGTLIAPGETTQVLATTRATIQKTLRSLVFVNTLYAVTKVSDSVAMSMMFDQVNDLLLRDDFGGCDDILRNVEVSKLPYNVMLGFLTFTFAARQHLQQRDDLYGRIMQRVEKDRGPTAAQALLKTLR